MEEPPELVAMRLALGQQLAAARNAARIGQPQIARRTGYSRPSISHAEAGRQLLTRQFWQQADELLDAKGVLLEHYERVRAAKEKHDTQSREAELARAYAEAQARAEALRAGSDPSSSRPGTTLAGVTGQEVLAGLSGAVGAELAGSLAGPLLYLALLSTPAQAGTGQRSEQLGEQLRLFLREWANTMQRREHLRLLGWVATAVAASPVLDLDSDEQQRLSQVITTPSRVDEQSIDHLDHLFQNCQRQEDAFGPYAVLHTVIAQREFVNSLLDNCPAELRPRLLSLYSSMSSSIGGYFFNLDDPVSAMHYCEQARKAAQEARNSGLAIYTLCLKSFYASWQGKAHTAIDLATAAQGLATKTDDQLLRACVAVEHGMAHAVDGQHKESMVAFDQALTELSLSAGRTPSESPVYWFHEGLVASHQSDCLLRLGKPAEAIAAAERGLQLFDSSFVSGMAFCTLRLGTGRLLCGEVEEAARVIGNGALLATKSRSARLTKEVQKAHARMRPWQHTTPVHELDEKLTGWGLAGHQV